MYTLRQFRILSMIFVLTLALMLKGVKCDDGENEIQESEGRTFGHHFLKRLSFAMIPIMYKMGMMTTLLVTLTIMSTKGLAVGVLLLVLAISQIIARAYTVPPPAQVSQPSVYPVVHYSQVPIVHKSIQPTVHVQPAALHAVPYGSGWHGKEIYNPYARQDNEEVEYENTH